MNDDTYFLPDPTITTGDVFARKLFKELFYVPGIKFNLMGSHYSFPNIPEKYIDRSDETQKNIITCYTKSTNKLRLRASHIMMRNNKTRFCWYVLPVIHQAKYIDDGDLSSEQMRPIMEHLLGLSWKTILDDSTFTIQKNRFINKYVLKKIIVEQMECFSVVKYVLISKLIELELPDETTHITTF
jgi:hypothetical protein